MAVESPQHTERDQVSSRRTLILIGAVVIGGLAAFLTMNYVKGVENENAAKNQLVDVLVAKGPIPKGTSADAALAAQQITVDKRRQADLPAQAVRRNAEIAEQVASVDLGGGEIITSNMFVGRLRPDRVEVDQPRQGQRGDHHLGRRLRRRRRSGAAG